MVSYSSLPVHTYDQAHVYTPAFGDLGSVKSEWCDLDSCNWFQLFEIPESSSKSYSFTVQYHGLCPTLGFHVPVALGWSDLHPIVQYGWMIFLAHLHIQRSHSSSSFLLSLHWHTFSCLRNKVSEVSDLEDLGITAFILVFLLENAQTNCSLSNRMKNKPLLMTHAVQHQFWKNTWVEIYKHWLKPFLLSKRPLDCRFVLNIQKLVMLSRQLPTSGCRHCGWICYCSASKTPSVAGRQENWI